jgi:hypothetical protein
MIGYISLLYAFLGDYFIFDVELSGLQTIGVVIVIFFSIGMIIYNCNHGLNKAREVVLKIEQNLLLPEEYRQPIPSGLDFNVKYDMVKKMTKLGVKRLMQRQSK